MPSKLNPGLVRWCNLTLAAVLVCQAFSAAAWAQPKRVPREWQDLVRVRLPQLGHRNWIVVADSAYPAQSREGIETIYVGGDQADAVAEVLAMVEKAPHVRPVVYLDQELKHVPEQDAPGVEAYREKLDELLEGRTASREPHEQIIEKLDEAAETFRVVILKTACTIPYTSVFLQLDCGYWSAQQEQRMRAAMQQQDP